MRLFTVVYLKLDIVMMIVSVIEISNLFHRLISKICGDIKLHKSLNENLIIYYEINYLNYVCIYYLIYFKKMTLHLQFSI